MNTLKSKNVFFCGNNFFMLSNFRKKTIQEFLLSGQKVTLIARSDGFERDFSNHKNLIIKAYKSKNKQMNFIFYLFFISKIFLKADSGYFFTFSSQNNVIYGILSYLKSQKIFMNVTGLGALWDIRFLKPLVKLILKISFRKANIIYCQNDRDYKLIKKLVNKKKIIIERISGSGVDLDTFTPPSVERNFKQLKFAMVARLKKRKGYITYLDACEILKEKSIKCSFYLASGYKSDQKIINRLRKEYKATEILDFQSNMESFYKKVDCVILPSTYNEGTPKSLLEALSSGCAIITSNRPGCSDTVLHNKNGYLLENINPKELSNLMLDYINLEIQRKQQFSQKSRELAEKKFDQNNIVRTYQKCLY